MSTHKHFDKICCVVLALTLVITVLFMNGENLGIKNSSTVMKYESTLFDNTKVHTIDIVMDNWDEFTANARSEEYYTCSVVIDGEAFKNVAIRGKGNTSLSQVTNDRYSYKIEFDHYDSTSTYYGLDKLALNNVIQDNTYMKDYLTYTMMNDMGVAAPLCSYAYITVNGEDWGLYLAVEGVEESFLQRNYGKDYGDLYKPDSMNMGGGRGNGEKFDINDFLGDFNKDSAETTTQAEITTAPTTTETTTEPVTEATTQPTTEPTTTAPDSTTPTYPDIPEGSNPFGGELPEGFTFPEGMEPPQGGGNPFGGQMPEDMTPPDFGGDNPFGGQMPEGSAPSVSSVSKTSSDNYQDDSSRSGMTLPNFNGENPFGDEMPEGMTPPDFSGENPFGSEMPDFSQMPEGMTPPTDENGNLQMPENFSDMFGGGKGGFGGMGSSDVKLQYIDDDADSYSNIFGNAKTDITKADKTRLIEALKNLSNGEELESTVDIEAVIRYFVVHNFVVNSDSYTGSMIHNYYLYENDGRLQMIPWDYNLAFGSFMSMGSATSSVNDPIDTPLSVSGSGDRPMIDWIFSNEEYTELYHQIFGEFIEKYFNSGYYTEMIDSVTSMISPYVEKDPTKFCTYEEFEKGVATLKEFCLLRAESVKGQLNGTIGSTSATQKEETLIDASHINTSDMGSMGSMGGGKGGFDGNMQRPQSSSDSSTNSEASAETSSDEYDPAENNNGSSNSRPQMPGDFGGGERPGSNNRENDNTQGNSSSQMQRPDGNFPDRGQSQSQPQSMISASSLVMIGVSVLILCLGIVVALNFKRRK